MAENQARVSEIYAQNLTEKPAAPMISVIKITPENPHNNGIFGDFYLFEYVIFSVGKSGFFILRCHLNFGNFTQKQTLMQSTLSE